MNSPRLTSRTGWLVAGVVGTMALLTGLVGACIPDIVLKNESGSGGSGGSASASGAGGAGGATSSASGTGGIGGAGGAASGAGGAGGDASASSTTSSGSGGLCPKTPFVGCNGLTFDGTGSTFGSVADGVPGGLTDANLPKMIGAWVRLSSDGFTGTVFAMGNEAACNAPACWGGMLALVIYNGKPGVSAGQAGIFTSDKTMPLNTWTYVYAGFDKDFQNGYFVGQLGLNADHQATPNIGTTGKNFLTKFEPVRIGTGPGNKHFKGQIDRIEVYSPAPNGAQRKQLAAMTTAELLSNSEKLFWLWSLDEGDPALKSTDERRCTTATITSPVWWNQPAPAGCPMLGQ